MGYLGVGDRGIPTLRSLYPHPRPRSPHLFPSSYWPALGETGARPASGLSRVAASGLRAPSLDPHCPLVPRGVRAPGSPA